MTLAARIMACSLLAWVGGACTAPEPAPTPRVRVGEVLRVGTSGDYPPFTVQQPSGTPTPGATFHGFSIDLAHALGDALGREVEFVTFEWPELADDLVADRFDVAISGVTWRPQRDLLSPMSQAFASGGPCIVGASDPARVAVNRGGILERWAQQHFAAAVQLRAVDDNLSLPALLAAGEVDAFVTDRFEVRHFAEVHASPWCAPPVDRKVIWFAPGALHLIEPVDFWLRQQEVQVDALRRLHFGESAPRDAADHLVDLLARRLEFMPLVARDKQRRALPIADSARESVVLDAAVSRAASHGLDPEIARRFFALQIDLAKQVQQRTQLAPQRTEDEPTLEQIRPVLLRLGEQIIDALLAVEERQLATLLQDAPRAAERRAPLERLLDSTEARALLQLAKDLVPAAPAAA